jgi:hypothetical protein
MPHFLKINYGYKAILNLQNQPHKIKQIKMKNIGNFITVFG